MASEAWEHGYKAGQAVAEHVPPEELNDATALLMRGMEHFALVEAPQLRESMERQLAEWGAEFAVAFRNGIFHAHAMKQWETQHHGQGETTNGN